MNLPKDRSRIRMRDWVAVKDAALKIVADGLDPDGERIERLTRRLVALDDVQGSRLAGHAYALGHDLGRHVYAKRIATDDFGATLDAVANAIGDNDWAEMDVELGLHREAHLRWRPAGADIDPGVRDALVVGLIEGTVTEALNTRLDLRPAGDGLRLELRSGPEPDNEGEPS